MGEQRSVIITGALGHIGSALVREPAMLANDPHLILIDNLATQRYCSLFNLTPGPTYQFLASDVADALTPELAANSDAIIHLAGTVDPVRSAGEPSSLAENNLRITTHVVDVCRATSTPMIFVSSTSVYTPRGPRVDERSDETHPVSPYAQCKLAEERYITDRLTPAHPYLILRLGTIFGPSPGMRFQTAVSKFCLQAVQGLPIDVWRSALEQVRPYLALPDCTRVVAHAVRDGVFPGEVVNAVTCNVTVRDVLDCIRTAGYETTVNLIDSPLMSELSFGASTQRAAELGFSFTETLDEGVRRTLEILAPLGKAAP